MSEQKIGLCVNLLAEVFGERVGEVGKYLCLWKRVSICDIQLDKVHQSLAVLIHHNLVTYKKTDRGTCEFSLDIDKVLHILQYPKYVFHLKQSFGDNAERLVCSLLKSGQECASGVILKSLSAESTSDDAKTLHKTFCDLAAAKFIMRIPAEEGGDSKEQDPFLVPPDVKLAEIIQRLNGSSSKAAFPDAAIHWKINHDAFQTEFRDTVLTLAVTRRVDTSAGNLMRIILKLAKADWFDVVSKHFYLTDVVDAIAASKDERLKRFREQYTRVLEEDRMRFVDRVGDEGGGAFQVNFGHVFTQLAAVTLENVVLEKFGSKALRIFRVIREKKYLEESQIQSLVMMPIKETKLLTYQLLENNFIQLQELKKSLASSAPSKSFYLFYIDMKRVSRMVLEMCYKSVNNLLARQRHESESNARLLDKQDRVLSMVAEVKSREVEDPAELEIQLQDIEEMLSTPERAQIKYVQSCLGKLRKATHQVEETMFLINMYLQACA